MFFSKFFAPLQGSLILFALLLISGCASRKEIVRFQQDTQYIRQQLDEIRAETTVMQKQLTQTDKTISALRDENRRTRADLMTEISSLKNQSAFLESKLEDTSSRMRNLLRRVDVKTADQAQDSTAETVSPESSAAAPPDPAAVKLYDLARLDFSRGHYDLALNGFKEFLGQYPQNEFAVDAQFWIGEILFLNGDFAGALEAFQNVILMYSSGQKTAIALLKIGYCLAELNDDNGAVRYFQAVVQRFPNSQEASLAAFKLDELKKTGIPKP